MSRAGQAAPRALKSALKAVQVQHLNSVTAAANEPRIGNRATQALLREGAIRAKLEVGRIDDPLEREADQTADRVMRSPMTDGVSPADSSGDDGGMIRRTGENGGSTSRHPARVDRASLGLGAGVGLPSVLRGFFEPRFGRDFSRVQIHSEGPAAAGARSIGARAYTLGDDIAFADGHYRPDTLDGRHLIAHELAHVVQGGGDRVWRQPDQSAPTAPQSEGKAGPDPSSSAALAADIAAAARDPEPGEHRASLPGPQLVFLPALEGIATLSDNPAHCRRSLARVIGKLGLEATDHAISRLEFGAGMPWAREAEKIVAPIARQEFARLKQDWVQLSARVRTVASMRLEHNIQALGQWSDYVAKLSPERVRADMVASNNLNFVQKAIDQPVVGPHNMIDLAEEWATTASRGRRGYVEMLGKDRIHGGCQDCHTQKDIPEFDRRLPSWHESRIPISARSRDVALAAFLHGGPGDASIMGQTLPGEVASGQMRDVAAGKPGITALLDAADMTRPQFRTIQVEASGRTDFVASLRAANVIVEDTLDAGLSGEALYRSVLSAIDLRRFQMANLKADLQDPDYDFLLLQELVNRLLGGVDADVRVMIQVALQTRIDEANERGLLERILGIASLILMVTPLAPLGMAIGAGLAVSAIEQGWTSNFQGRDIARGMGAGLFTREQEEAAGEMMTFGMISMALGAVNLLATGIAVAGAARAGTVADDAAGALVRSEQAAARAGAGESFMPDAVYSRPVFDEATGTMRVSATRVTAQGAGETMDVTVNMRTGVGEAVVTTPQGRYVVRFNQNGVTEVVSPAGVATPAPGAGAPQTALVPTSGRAVAPSAAPPPLLPRREQLLLPMAENDFTAIHRDVFGADFGTTPAGWRVSPSGVVVPETPFRTDIPVHLGDVAPPDMLFGQTQIMRGQPVGNLTPFDYLMPNSTVGSTARTLAQVRQTPRGASSSIVSHERGSRGSIHVTQRMGAGATDAFSEVEVPNWPKARRPDIRQPLRTGDNLAVESKNYRYFHNPGGGSPTVTRFVPLDSRIAGQLNADALLMHQANSTYRPLWVFVDAPPSTALVNRLNEAGIPYIYWGDRLPQ